MEDQGHDKKGRWANKQGPLKEKVMRVTLSEYKAIHKARIKGVDLAKIVNKENDNDQ